MSFGLWDYHRLFYRFGHPADCRTTGVLSESAIIAMLGSEFLLLLNNFQSTPGKAVVFPLYIHEEAHLYMAFQEGRSS